MKVADEVSRNLEKAEALLQCVMVSLEYGEDQLHKAPDYRLVLKMACGLLRDSIRQLDD